MWWRGLAACTEVKVPHSFAFSRRQSYGVMELWSYGAMVFTVPLYLKAKSQGVLKEYDIHQDLRL
jgi:hypothetical protein